MFGGISAAIQRTVSGWTLEIIRVDISKGNLGELSWESSGTALDFFCRKLWWFFGEFTEENLQEMPEQSLGKKAFRWIPGVIF